MVNDELVRLARAVRDTWLRAPDGDDHETMRRLNPLLAAMGDHLATLDAAPREATLVRLVDDLLHTWKTDTDGATYGALQRLDAYRRSQIVATLDAAPRDKCVHGRPLTWACEQCVSTALDDREATPEGARETALGRAAEHVKTLYTPEAAEQLKADCSPEPCETCGALSDLCDDLRARLAAAEADRDRWKAEAHDMRDNQGRYESYRLKVDALRKCQADLDAARAEVERLREYAWHKEGCYALTTDEGVCDCGFVDIARAALSTGTAGAAQAAGAALPPGGHEMIESALTTLHESCWAGTEGRPGWRCIFCDVDEHDKHDRHAPDCPIHQLTAALIPTHGAAQAAGATPVRTAEDDVLQGRKEERADVVAYLDTDCMYDGRKLRERIAQGEHVGTARGKGEPR